MRSVGVPVLLLVLAAGTAAAGRGINGGRAEHLQRPLGTPNRTHLDINRLQAPFWDNGISDYDYGRTGDAGLIYPKGSGKSAIYAAGFWWGARYGVGGDLRVGGINYFSGLRSGRILPGMVAESDSLPQCRVYRVRPDIPPGSRTADVSSEEMDGEGSADDIYDQYHKDWLEWPWQNGAPYVDLNENGSYEPETDIPGVAGADQTLWFVANDLDAGTMFYAWGCNLMGVEMQMTAWAYARQDALGSMLFRKYVLINKSSTAFDSMYVAMWLDPDLGNPGDDLVGCDTSRSLGFVYNGYETDTRYAPLPPPSVGYDFFQGPVVLGAPSDSAIFRGRRVYGKRNLPMTAFFAFDMGAPDPSYQDPDYLHPAQIYNLLKGQTRDGKPWRTPGGDVTRFPFPGDPGTQTGWLDGQMFPAGDRRMGLSSGPFTMMPSDTQEIVVAEIAAGAAEGIDRLAAVSMLKSYDDLAQVAYDNFFVLPVAPPAPKVTVAALDREVVLSWGDDLEAVSATESATISGYAFQGYNVYQLPSASAAVSEGKRLATYDLVDGVQKIRDSTYDSVQGENVAVVKQFGTDSGIRRYIQLKTDPFSNNNPLVNGAPYYYAVTAYNYNPNPAAVPRTLENPISIITVYPHTPDPGVRYSTSSGDTLTDVSHTSSVPGRSPSDGRVVAQIVNPTLLKAATYSVVFAAVDGDTVWHLIRTEGTAVDTIVKNVVDQSGSDASSPIVDGILFRVFAAPTGFSRFLVVSNGAGEVIPPEMGAFAFNNSGFPTIDGKPPDGTNDRPTGRQQLGGGLWGVECSDGVSESFDLAWFFQTTTRNGANWPRIFPNDFEIRFTAGGSKAKTLPLLNAVLDVPFELWNIGPGSPDDPTDDYRMIPRCMDVKGNRTFDLDHKDHTIDGGDNDPETDRIFWRDPLDKTPGTAGYDAWVASNFNEAACTGPEVFANMVLVNWNGGSVSDSAFPANVNQTMPEVGTVFRILVSRPNRPGDVFTVAAPPNSYSADVARADISAINVFPNPYYGVNPQEIDKYSRFVTFSHLPQRATIRIFNLSGVMVRRIDRYSTSQFEQWDLKNENGLPVGSGMYIAHIEMPDLGVSKVLKIAIVQEQQILDRY